MTIYDVRRRVLCYVTRETEAGSELLVFEHAADVSRHPAGEAAEPPGIQVPAGGMRPFEALADAARRETADETGLTGLCFVGQVGWVERARGEPGGPAMTTFVHLTAPDDGPTSWDHRVTGEGDDSGMLFRCRWEPLPLAFELAADQARFLDAVAP